jgi:hypothetical protein
MKEKEVKKNEIKKVPAKETKKSKPAEANNPAEQTDNDKEEDISAEHIKGLSEALENSDIGKPVTLKEFKKMMKKLNDQ